MRISRLSVYIVAAAVLAGLGGCGRSGPSTRLTLQVDTAAATNWPKAKAERLAIMERAKKTVENRFTGFLETGCEVTIKDDDKLAVLLHGVSEPKELAAATSRICTRGGIAFYHLGNVRSANNPMGEWEIESKDTHPATYVFTDLKGQKIDSDSEPAAVLARVVKAKENEPILTESDLLPNAKATYDQEQEPSIIFELNDAGAQKFRDFTTKNVHEHVAVFYNGKMLITLVVLKPVSKGPLVVGGFTRLKEAIETAEVINSGVQPVPLKVVGKETVKKS